MGREGKGGRVQRSNEKTKVTSNKDGCVAQWSFKGVVQGLGHREGERRETEGGDGGVEVEETQSWMELERKKNTRL